MKPVDYYQIMFVYLRLSGHVEWPWLVVFLPTIIMLLLTFVARMTLKMLPASTVAGWLREAGVR